MKTKPPQARRYAAEPPPVAQAQPPRLTRYVRPSHPATFATLRVQQRTARSFETAGPPDVLCGWLLDQGFKPIAKSINPHEYGRLARGRTPEGKPAELVILYWSGSALCQGSGAEQAAALLASICEPSPAGAMLFDSLADVDGGAL